VSAKQRADRERVRLEAAEMFDQDVRPSMVAKLLRISTKSAYAWRRQWRAGGTEALRSKGPGGATCRLTDEQLGWLRADLELGPAAFGDQFKIRHTDRGMDYLLHRIGYTPQVPVRRAASRDPQTIEAWVREVWPQVTAPRRPGTPGSSSKTNPARA
jgi:putative transposase